VFSLISGSYINYREEAKQSTPLVIFFLFRDVKIWI